MPGKSAIPSHLVKARIAALRRLMDEHGLPWLLVSNPCNVRYLTDFRGSDSLLLVGLSRTVLVTDGRFVEEAQRDLHGVDVVVRDGPLCAAVARVLKDGRASRAGFEANSVTQGDYLRLRRECRGRTRLLPTQRLVEGLRSRKDAFEVEQIRRAIRCAEEAFRAVRAGLSPDTTEKQVADAIEMEVRKAGGEGTSFTPIVAAGVRSSRPHATVTDLKIGRKPVLIDWGARYGGYDSDLTRMACLGSVPVRYQKIVETVIGAQEAARAQVRPGVAAADVDKAARDHIESKGYGRNFLHGLGHGVGLEIHEAPGLNRMSRETLAEGMVCTLEPAIYIPDWGGVRIEDVVLVTRRGCRPLTHIGSEL